MDDLFRRYDIIVNKGDPSMFDLRIRENSANAYFKFQSIVVEMREFPDQNDYDMLPRFRFKRGQDNAIITIYIDDIMDHLLGNVCYFDVIEIIDNKRIIIARVQVTFKNKFIWS